MFKSVFMLCIFIATNCSKLAMDDRGSDIANLKEDVKHLITDLANLQDEINTYADLIQCYHGSSNGSSNIRLVALDGTISSAGRLEVFHNGQWGTVCDDAPGEEGGDQNNNNMANVVCRMLGFNSGQVKTRREYGRGTGPIWLDNVDCTGDELSILDCRHNGWAAHDCGHEEDVGVVCSNQDEYIRGTDGYSYNFHQEPLTWDAASNLCLKEDAYLAMIKTEETYTYIWQRFWPELWIGVTDKANDGTFLFVDGTKVKNPYFGFRELNNQGGHEDCVVTNYKNYRGRWNNRDCSILLPFLCQKPTQEKTLNMTACRRNIGNKQMELAQLRNADVDAEQQTASGSRQASRKSLPKDLESVCQEKRKEWQKEMEKNATRIDEYFRFHHSKACDVVSWRQDAGREETPLSRLKDLIRIYGVGLVLNTTLYGRASCLMTAVKNGWGQSDQLVGEDLVKYQILECSDVNYKAGGSGEDMTALHWAGWCFNKPIESCVKIARWLVEAGGVIDALDKYGKTPLRIAIEHQHADIVKEMMKLCASLHKAQAASKDIDKYNSAMKTDQIKEAIVLGESFLQNCIPDMFSLTKATENAYVAGELKTLELKWRLEFGSFTKNDFVYSLYHRYKRVDGTEGISLVSLDYPTQCPPALPWGLAHCGFASFAGRVIMYITTMSEAGLEYDALIVKIKNVTLADFNVDPDRSEGDLSTREMKFEARMLCSVQEYVSERSQYSAIHVAYIRDDVGPAPEEIAYLKEDFKRLRENSEFQQDEINRLKELVKCYHGRSFSVNNFFSDPHYGYAGSSSIWDIDDTVTYAANQAFKNTDDRWASREIPAMLYFKFNTPVTVAKIGFLTPSGSAWNQAPRDFALIASMDSDCNKSSRWHVLRNVNKHSYGNAEQELVNIWSIPCDLVKPWRCYGINATANAGSQYDCVSVKMMRMVLIEGWQKNPDIRPGAIPQRQKADGVGSEPEDIAYLKQDSQLLKENLAIQQDKLNRVKDVLKCYHGLSTPVVEFYHKKHYGYAGASSIMSEEYAANKAFKNSNEWWMGHEFPATLFFRFSTPVTVAKIGFQAPGAWDTWDQAPRDFALIASMDHDCNAHSKWDVLRNVSHLFTLPSQEYIWSIPCNTVKPWKCYGIRVTANSGDSCKNCTSVMNMKMYLIGEDWQNNSDMRQKAIQ